MKTIFRILLITMLCLNTINIFAQANTWLPLGSGLNNGTNGNVYAITSFNGKIIIGGSFTQAGGVSARNIASYDPALNTFSALSTGITGEVYALTTRGSELIAGGLITQAGSTNVNNIARWNGSAWNNLGSGINGEVRALIVYSGDLVAGGNFTSAGGNGASNIASWNGSSWDNLGSGLTGSGDRVNSLTIYLGSLVAGGRFEESGSTDLSNVAWWNGLIWGPFGISNFDDDVNAVISFNNELYAGGDFTDIGGSDRNYIAKWNGSLWVNVGGGLDDVVNAFSVFKNTLIVGGNFRVTGTNLFVDRISIWNGNSWSRMLTGHDDNVKTLYTNMGIDTVLYSGGEYTSAGGKWAYYTGMWGSYTTSTVSGFARYADNGDTVKSGLVKIVRMDVITREIIVVDSALVADGNYILRKVPKRDSTLRVMIFPDDELLDENAVLNYVPTYYPSTISWANASVIYAMNNLTNININVIRSTGPTDGNSSVNIGGYVYLNIAPPPGAFPFLSGSVIYLNNGSNFLKFAVTDESMHYSLTGLTAGTYSLTVQRLGYETETRQVILGGANQDTVNFYLDTMNVIGIVNINSNVPDNYSLQQNYPNPFNPQTKIRFDIKKASFTELKIYDMLGREIRTLVNENLKAGEYEVSFNAVNLPSGVYFYRLNTESFTETKKMILIK